LLLNWFGFGLSELSLTISLSSSYAISTSDILTDALLTRIILATKD
jgi:hypothetical protein